MKRFWNILGKGALIALAAAASIQREQAILAFPRAVEAGDDVEADRQIALAANADEALKAFGFPTPPPRG